MVGKNWRDLFDMVIVQADKPNFFTDRRKYVSPGQCCIAACRPEVLGPLPWNKQLLLPSKKVVVF